MRGQTRGMAILASIIVSLNAVGICQDCSVGVLSSYDKVSTRDFKSYYILGAYVTGGKETALDTDKLSKNKEIELFCAKGERESFQILLMPRKDGLKVSLQCGDLSRPDGKTISGKNIQYNPVGYHHAQLVIYKKVAEWKSYTTDVLFNDKVIGLYKGFLQPVWITVHVPRDTKAGVYQGEIKVVASDKTVIGKVKIKLKVWDFAIPKKTPLWVIPYGDIPAAMKKAGYDHKDRKQILKYCKAHAKILSDYYIQGATFQRVWCTTKDGKVDFSLYEEVVETMMRQGVYRFQIFLPSVNRPKVGWPEYYKQLAQFLNKKGWNDIFIEWVGRDEPGTPALRKLAKKHQEWAEKAGLLHHGGCILDYKGIPNLFEQLGPYKVWVLGNPHNAVCDFMKERRTKGEHVWWYVMGDRSPEWLYSNSNGEVRSIPWFCRQLDVTGWTSYGYDLWRNYSGSPWDFIVDPATRTYPKAGAPAEPPRFMKGSGVNWRIYFTKKPNLENPLLASIRLSSLRDGLEDYAYLHVLNEIAKRLEKEGKKDSAKLARDAIAKSVNALGGYGFFFEETGRGYVLKKALPDNAKPGSGDYPYMVRGNWKIKDVEFPKYADFQNARTLLAETIITLRGK